MGNDDVSSLSARTEKIGNDDVASVNARREYMGNVTVSVNQKSLPRGCRVFIENAWVVLPSVILRALRYRTCFQYVTPAEQLF